MESLDKQTDNLRINISLSALPAISFMETAAPLQTPLASHTENGNRFSMALETTLPYPLLSQALNGFLAGKRFDISEGFFKKQIIIEKTAVSGTEGGLLAVKAHFSGSFKGTALFIGNPVYNPVEKSIEVQNLTYSLDTNNLFLKAAKWLLNGLIRNQLEKYTRFDLSAYYNTVVETVNNRINSEWIKGISGEGAVSSLTVTSVTAGPEHLLVRSTCSGGLAVSITLPGLQV